MKIYFLTLLFLLSLTTLYSQKKEILNKIWISPSLKYLDLRQNDTAFFDYGMGYHEKYNLEIEDSLFRLVQYDLIHGIKEPQRVVKSYKIIKLTQDTLLIHPLNKYSKLFLENDDGLYADKFYENPDSVNLNENDNYVFLDKSIYYDSSLTFNMIYFRSSPCYGTCPSMEFKIDSIGNFYFFGDMYTGKYKGNYHGKLSTDKFENLKEILKSSALDNIPTNLGIAIDSPEYKLTINYNGKIKNIDGYSFPYFNQPLLNFLLNIYKETNMKKNKDENFKLSNEKNESLNR